MLSTKTVETVSAQPIQSIFTRLKPGVTVKSLTPGFIPVSTMPP